MPPQTQRKRRAGDYEDEDVPRQRQPKRQGDSEEDEESEPEEDGDVDMSGAGSSDDAQSVKKLVRYALACEYARVPIRRDGIRDKVLASNPRSFKKVFDGAQLQLRQVFGMEMAELPAKEKRTIKEKQKANAAQRNKSASQSTASSRTYILVSILPRVYKTQAIIGPSRVPSSSEEAEFVGFYTFVLALICLSGGDISDAKLKDYLQRMNADENLPFDKTNNVLAKLVRQGYLDKVVERSDDGEDAITWCVGTRAKVEVPPETIAAIVRQVWQDPPNDLHKRINKSLGLQGSAELQADEAEDDEEGEGEE
ncbi:hypothetical protein JX265_008312 [Neoarthrinium moseri]|uniref:MAGE domain-containing protein n=1 Tax=Neoarthrinium moseri TaxID=1658444 RepID=A0A9Q0AMW2_9PEZI|nr:hypothetical protein JX266_002735 [Neoarthrinium moseri]KAI1865265.1 hypothetical protein JX265_008312 [Neoarthrinium moseri]